MQILRAFRYNPLAQRSGRFCGTQIRGPARTHGRAAALNCTPERAFRGSDLGPVSFPLGLVL
ncbi:MAG: hypothetical protein LBK44_00265 [Spirochaetales bacterium]|nr:hypothetical protein [Spirochaetales bacterium]